MRWHRHETLPEGLDLVWLLLARFTDRHLTPRLFVTIATTDENGMPQLRKVALRGQSRAAGEVQVFTDKRSIKVHEITQNPKSAVLAWDPAHQVQIRLTGHARVETGKPLEEVWAALPPAARLSYSHMPAPGSPIEAGGAYSQTPDLAYFARITLTIDAIDYVNLADNGHRRAVFLRTDGWQGAWRSP